MEFVKEVLIPGRMADTIKQWLISSDPVDDAPINCVLYRETVVFTPKMSADILVVNGGYGPIVEAILFQDGEKVHDLAFDHHFAIEGDYEFHFDLNVFTARIREIDQYVISHIDPDQSIYDTWIAFSREEADAFANKLREEAKDDASDVSMILVQRVSEQSEQNGVVMSTETVYSIYPDQDEE